MLALALHGGDQPQHVVLAAPIGGRDGHDLRLAGGQRAGLVEDDRVDGGGQLQAQRVLGEDRDREGQRDQEAVARARRGT
jgi:hypothetical protein